MFAVLLVAKLLPHFGQGPSWDANSLSKGCSKYWWTNLLYINNFHPSQVIYIVDLSNGLLLTF